MARPNRPDLDYYPADTHKDEKMELIEAEHGLIGYAIVQKLWELIYGNEGYFCKWNDDNRLLFCKKNGCDKDTLDGVVQSAIDREIFDSDMYKNYQILTSHGIQVRYLEATKKRSKIVMENDYLLLKKEELAVYGTLTIVYGEKTPIKVTEMPQSKVKESKVNKSKVEESKTRARKSAFQRPTLDELIEYIEEAKLNVDANRFIDYYESAGWKVGRNSMKDWKAAARNWSRREDAQAIQRAGPAEIDWDRV